MPIMLVDEHVVYPRSASLCEEYVELDAAYSFCCRQRLD